MQHIIIVIVRAYIYKHCTTRYYPAFHDIYNGFLFTEQLNNNYTYMLIVHILSENMNGKNKQQHKTIDTRLNFVFNIVYSMNIMLTSLQYELIIGFIEPT